MKTDVLIIGGGPAAAVAAGSVKMHYPTKEITIVKMHETGVVPCGIPYMVHSLNTPEENILSFKPLQEKGIELIIDELIEIDRGNNTVKTQSGKNIEYEKLILAIGSSPIIPRIEGFELKNVFPIKKEFNYLKNLIAEIKKHKDIVILGGGFIGIEFADEISKLEDKNITIVEMMPNILSGSFDPEFSDIVLEKLKNQNINILSGTKVVSLNGNAYVESVALSDGSQIKAQVVISGLGAHPNTEIATKSGLVLGRGKGLWVDEYLKTIDDDIFAVGDCACKRDFFTRRDNPVMLASTASAEARIAGANIYTLKLLRENKGTIAVFSTSISGLVIASCGLTETRAKAENVEIACGYSEVIDKHPGTLPGNNKIKTKLVFSKQSGTLMGAQLSGGNSVGEIINILGIGIQNSISAAELETLQIATHPCLTPPPTKYHIVLAAQDALKKVAYLSS